MSKQVALADEMELAAVAIVVEEEALWLKVNCETIRREVSIDQARRRISLIRTNLDEMEQRIDAVEAKMRQV